jgi:predicted nucleotidyltransferase
MAPIFVVCFLYGSMTRGKAEKSSDIDILVLLAKPFSYFDQLRKIIELLYPIQLKSEHLISAKPVAEDEFASGTIRFYRTAKLEGRAV